MNDHPIVRITWDDASTNNGWMDFPPAPLTPEVVITVGFLIQEDDCYIQVAHTVSDSQFNGYIQIPKDNIINRETL